MIVEVHGIEQHGFHGVNEDERRDGQTFLFDVTLDVDEPARDAIDATVDYRAVRDCVREVSDGTRFQLLESLAAAVADAVFARFAPNAVTVRVRKPGIAWAEWTAATASRASSS